MPNYNPDIKYEFFFDGNDDVGGGVESDQSIYCTYDKYLSNLPLRNIVMDPTRERLIAGRRIFTFSKKYWNSRGGRQIKHRKETEGLRREVEANPLAFASPSRLTTPDHAGTLGFLNDFLVSTLKGLRGPNQSGKTWTCILDDCLSLVPCDPEWEIFKYEGVKFREWTGPKKMFIGIYNWPMHRRKIWPEFVKLLPPHELGDYGPMVPAANRKTLQDRTQMIPLTCGSQIVFGVYEQELQVFESDTFDWAHWSEQPKPAQWNAIDERTSAHPQHKFDWTPHEIEGMPHTGSGTFMHRLETGEISKGHDARFYQFGLDDVPEWNFKGGEKKKRQRYIKWVEEPEKQMQRGVPGAEKLMREGRARYFGEYHASGDVIFDDFDDAIHMIPPMRPKDEWSLGRGLDHGSNNPSACSWWAVTPEQVWILYRCYKQRGAVVSQHVEQIISLSGNNRVFKSWREEGDHKIKVWSEEYVKERYEMTCMDPRAYSWKTDAGIKVGVAWRDAGLHLRQGSGKFEKDFIPMAQQMFLVDPNLRHPITGEMGSPRILICEDCSLFVDEIKNWEFDRRKHDADEHEAKETGTDKNIDLIKSWQYLLMSGMKYYGPHGASGLGNREEDDPDSGRRKKRTSGVKRRTRRVRSAVGGY